MTGPALLAEYFSAQFAALAADLTAMVTHPAFFGAGFFAVCAVLSPFVVCALQLKFHCFDEFGGLLVICLLFFVFVALGFHYVSWCGV